MARVFGDPIMNECDLRWPVQIMCVYHMWFLQDADTYIRSILQIAVLSDTFFITCVHCNRSLWWVCVTLQSEHSCKHLPKVHLVLSTCWSVASSLRSWKSSKHKEKDIWHWRKIHGQLPSRLEKKSLSSGLFSSMHEHTNRTGIEAIPMENSRSECQQMLFRTWDLSHSVGMQNVTPTIWQWAQRQERQTINKWPQKPPVHSGEYAVWAESASIIIDHLLWDSESLPAWT